MDQPSLWDLSCENQRLEDMLTIYQDHIEVIEAENKELRAKVTLLMQRLEMHEDGSDPEDRDTEYSS